MAKRRSLTQTKRAAAVARAIAPAIIVPTPATEPAEAMTTTAIHVPRRTLSLLRRVAVERAIRGGGRPSVSAVLSEPRGAEMDMGRNIGALLIMLALTGCVLAPTVPSADERMVPSADGRMVANGEYVDQVTGHRRWGSGYPAQLGRAKHDATEQAAIVIEYIAPFVVWARLVVGSPAPIARCLPIDLIQATSLPASPLIRVLVEAPPNSHECLDALLAKVTVGLRPE